MKNVSRRIFLEKGLSGVASAFIGGSLLSGCSDLLEESAALKMGQNAPQSPALFFNISLAEWSLHKTLWAGKIDHLDFVEVAKKEFGISAVEYVNQFFSDKAEDTAYLNEMNRRAGDHGVDQLIIMIDAEGSLATLKEDQRKKAIENHYKWINAAKYLGCRAIRVNAYGKGDRQAVMNAAVDSLGTLSAYAEKENIDIVVENHGGYSSDPAWLTEVMKQVGVPNCGTLPDFGNFFMTLFPYRAFDPVKGTKELMPFARGVSAKSKDFDSNGNHKTYDFLSLLEVVRDSGFKGHIGIEYEGYKLSEYAGIRATKELLIKCGQALS